MRYRVIAVRASGEKGLQLVGGGRLQKNVYGYGTFGIFPIVMVGCSEQIDIK